MHCDAGSQTVAPTAQKTASQLSSSPKSRNHAAQITKLLPPVSGMLKQLQVLHKQCSPESGWDATRHTGQRALNEERRRIREQLEGKPLSVREHAKVECCPSFLQVAQVRRTTSPCSEMEFARVRQHAIAVPKLWTTAGRRWPKEKLVHLVVHLRGLLWGATLSRRGRMVAPARLDSRRTTRISSPWREAVRHSPGRSRPVKAAARSAAMRGRPSQRPKKTSARGSGTRIIEVFSMA